MKKWLMYLKLSRVGKPVEFVLPSLFGIPSLSLESTDRISDFFAQLRLSRNI
jgi:hypothetical protein